MWPTRPGRPSGRARAARLPAAPRRRPGLLALLGPVTLLAACASTRPLRPVAPGRTQFSASVGGPLVKVGGPVLPAPMLMLGAARGLHRRPFTATAELGVTAALYGNLHLAPGLMYHPVVRGPGLWPSLALGGSLHLVTDLGDLLVAPQTTAVAAWALGQRHLVYAGADLAVPIGSPTRVLAGPLLGAELGGGSIGYGLEMKWLAPYHDVEPAAPNWISPGHHGYLTILLSLTYRGAP